MGICSGLLAAGHGFGWSLRSCTGAFRLGPCLEWICHRGASAAAITIARLPLTVTIISFRVVIAGNAQAAAEPESPTSQAADQGRLLVPRWDLWLDADVGIAYLLKAAAG